MIQTNSFSEQIYKRNQINTLSTAKNLILTCAIIATILSVPGVGLLLGLIFQIPMIASLIISIITLVFVRKANRPMTGSIFLIIANTLSFLTFFMLIYITSLPYYSDAHESSSIFYAICALFAWISYVVAAIILFIEFNSTNKVLIELKFQNTTLFQAPFASPQPTPIPQTPSPAPVQHTQQTNPFATQPEAESTPTPNPFINQDVVQPAPISELPQQDKQLTNPFLTEAEEIQDPNLFIDHK